MGAQWRTACQGARAEPEAGAKWRRNGAQEIATAGTAAVVVDGAGCVGAQPMTAKVTERVNALNGETGQVLHLRFSLSCAARRKKPSARKNRPTLRDCCNRVTVVSRQNSTRCRGIVAN